MTQKEKFDSILVMINLITNLGLGEKEARVYLALLELGPSLVTEIAAKAGINRTSAYDVLERLIKYNLVTYASGVGSKKRYSAMPPHNLVQFLENQQKRSEKRLAELKEKLPELKMLYREPHKPSIKFFDGLEGVKAIYAETLKSTTEILSIGDCEQWETPELSVWAKDYNRKRAQNGIHERVLIPEASPKTIHWFTHYPTTPKYTHYKILPKGVINYVFDGEINIYEDKVVIVLLKKPNQLGIMITSADLVKMFKGLFEMAWLASGEEYSIKGKK